MKTSLLRRLEENLDYYLKNSEPLWHPLGFVSCLVESIQNNEFYRIHYWPKDLRRTKNPNWPIHTHCYDLESLILEGSITDIQYEIKKGEDHQVYQVEYSGEDSKIIKTNSSISLDIMFAQQRYQAESYFVPKGIFHQSEVNLKATAVTFVHLSNKDNTFPLVVGENKAIEYPYERIKYDKNHFNSVVHRAFEDCLKIKS